MIKIRHCTTPIYLALTCLLAISTSARSETSLYRTFQFDPGSSLVISTERCNISIVGSESWSVTVTAECDKDIEKYHELEFIELEEGLKIQSNAMYTTKENRSFWERLGIHNNDTKHYESLNLTIALPKQANIRIANTRGKIDIGTIDGEVAIKNTRNQVYCSEISGSLELKTSRGDVEVSSMVGPVDIQNSRGDIKLSGLSSGGRIVNQRGNIHLANSSGEFSITNRRGHTKVLELVGTVNGSAERGNMTVSFKGQPAGDCELSTHRGHLEIRMPENSGAAITADVHRGKLYSEHPFLYQNNSGGIIEGDKSVDSPKLRLSSNRGNIRIKSVDS